MPPAPATLLNTLYQTGAGAAGPPPPVPALLPGVLGPVPAGPLLYRNEHIIYQLNHARLDYGENPLAGTMVRNVSCNANPAGDTIYLKFFADQISSIRLTTPAPLGVTFFYTDNLSACKIFIDRIVGSNDLIVYHANTTQHTAGPLAWTDFQTPRAEGVLDAMRSRAQRDYTNLGAVPAHAAELAMPQYFAAAGQEERRKRAVVQRRGAPIPPHGAPLVDPNTGLPTRAARIRPRFSGGCFVCGFFIGAAWQFWYQTWGEVEYSRPGYIKGVATLDWIGVHKRLWEGAEHTATYATMQVLDRQQFF